MDLWGQTEVREKGMDRQIRGRVILLLLDRVRERTMTWKQRVYQVLKSGKETWQCWLHSLVKLERPKYRSEDAKKTFHPKQIVSWHGGASRTEEAFRNGPEAKIFLEMLELFRKLVQERDKNKTRTQGMRIDRK